MVLVVSPLAEDHRILCRIFSENQWKLEGVGRLEEAFLWIDRRGPPPIVICERILPDGDWKDLLGHLEALSRRPRLIVSSRLADEHLWCEVLNLLGDDVLATPFDHREVTHVVTCAWDSWCRQWRAPHNRSRESAEQTAVHR
jgi:DNA-binding response OmpR family regulator